MSRSIASVASAAAAAAAAAKESWCYGVGEKDEEAERKSQRADKVPRARSEQWLGMFVR